jgi:hypothetical protein
VRRPSSRRNAAAVIATLVTFSLGVMLAVFVAGSASAASSKGKTTTTKKTTTAPKTTTTATTTTATTATTATTTIPDTPAAHFFVLYGTANAASDHEIVGSSAFPNYTKGAVDNYYAMAHSHVDNSPFAEGTASPADTGPVGQTAAAGNFQQPQYADARWPGDPGKATYGSKGQPYAAAAASDYDATAEASAATNGLSGPNAPSMAAPNGFDGRLRLALAGWKATWQSRPGPKTPTVKGTVKNPTATVTTPTATVPTPIATVTTPTATVGGAKIAPPVPAPPVTMPLPTVPSTSARSTTTPSRSLAALTTSSSSSSSSGDGESLLESSTLTTLDPKTNALVTSGESTLGRVILGGGQIVIHGIHVSATITNDGTPTYKAAVSIAAASIGGVPVTIDQDGVHLAAQGQGVPYQQASDALNGALKQAGIRLFLVGPEVTTNSCAPTGTGSGTGTTTTASDQTSTTATTSSCDQTNSCAPTGTTTGPTTTTTTTTSSDRTGTTPTTSSCDQTSSCGPTGTATGTTTTTTTTSSNQTSTTPTTSWCDQTGMTTPTSSCRQTGKTTTTGSNNQTGTTPSTTTTTSSGDRTNTAPDTSSSGEETVTATGLHVVFTQPVGQSGVPAQYAEHILGEVFLDSLAVPAGPVPKLDLNLNFSSSSSSSSSSSCLGGHSRRAGTSGLAAAGGGSPTGGSASSGSLSSLSPLSPSASGFTSGSSANGGGLPTSLAEVASLLRSKPVWLLLAYLVWQTLAVITGVSLWNWRRGAAS